MRRAVGGLVLFVALPAWVQTTVQETLGWGSPAVAKVTGAVTIVCQGVDAKALARLNEPDEPRARVASPRTWTWSRGPPSAPLSSSQLLPH